MEASSDAGVQSEISALSSCSIADFSVREVKGVGQNGIVLSVSVCKPGFPFPPAYRVALKVRFSKYYNIIFKYKVHCRRLCSTLGSRHAA